MLLDYSIDEVINLLQGFIPKIQAQLFAIKTDKVQLAEHITLTINLVVDKKDIKPSISILSTSDSIEDKTVVKKSILIREDQSKNIYKEKKQIAEEVPFSSGIHFINENIVGIIKTYGYTDDFQKSNAGIFLKELGFGISNYALVMEKFDCTLKDLLEKRLGKFTLKFNSNTKNKLPSHIVQQLLEPKDTKKEKEEQIDNLINDLFKEENQTKLKESLKDSLKESIYELRGYDILEKMNFKERMEEILPYLEDVASGLRFLHQCELLHFDLKPANIFVKKLSDGKLKAVIGDLGYLSQSTRSKEDYIKDNNLSVIDPERRFDYFVSQINIRAK